MKPPLSLKVELEKIATDNKDNFTLVNVYDSPKTK